jgi:hypothetical protein
MKLHNKSIHHSIILYFLFISSASAAEIISPASEWSENVTLLTDRSSPIPTTSIADISNGVILNYESLTGGKDVGTSTYQYDFTQTALESGNILIDISADITLGTFDNILAIELIKNNDIIKSYSSIENAVKGTEAKNLLNLNAGDVWGIRVTTGNFSLSTGTVGEIRITAHIPEDCSARYSNDGTLTIPCVLVPDASGKITYYQANMQLLPNEDTISFNLLDTVKIGGKLDTDKCLVKYKDINNPVDIPCAFDPNATGSFDMFEATMKAIPSSLPLAFEVTTLTKSKPKIQ